MIILMQIQARLRCVIFHNNNWNYGSTTKWNGKYNNEECCYDQDHCKPLQSFQHVLFLWDYLPTKMKTLKNLTINFLKE
jgi:hypothetical protein